MDSNELTFGLTMIGLIAPLLFNYFYAKSMAERQFNHSNLTRRIDKVEEVAYLYNVWEVSFANVYILELRCMLNRLSESDKLEVVKNGSNNEPNFFQRFEALFQIYCHELSGDLAGIMDKRRKVVSYFGKRDQPDGTLADSFRKDQESFEAESLKFKRKITELARSLQQRD